MPGETFYIETYGCQMNEHDSEKMAALLEGMGLRETKTLHEAEVIVINTCSIREKAEHKVYSSLGRLRRLKKKNPRLVTVVAGCVAQQEKEKLLSRADHLDVVLGTHHIGELPAVIERVRKERERVQVTGFTQDMESLHQPAPCKGPSPVCSYVTVMQGCSNFCSYCVVPHTRGPEVSRPIAEIVDEIRSLVGRGVKEVTLLGQNVNAYGKDRSDRASFVELLQSIDAVDGIEGIRFTTSHPKDFDSALAESMARLPTVREHIHLPLQSGSDRILKEMRRGYDLTDYMEKVEMLRSTVPGVAITADIIVGFPGETDEDFHRTLEALEEIRYDQIFSFKYSPRPGTRAAGLPEQVPEQVKVERLARVHEVQEAITQAHYRAAEGTVEKILIEGHRPESGQAYGRTRTNRVVNIEPGDDARIGQTVAVRIVRALKHSLLGRIEN